MDGRGPQSGSTYPVHSPARAVHSERTEPQTGHPPSFERPAVRKCQGGLLRENVRGSLVFRL